MYKSMIKSYMVDITGGPPSTSFIGRVIGAKRIENNRKPKLYPFPTEIE